MECNNIRNEHELVSEFCRQPFPLTSEDRLNEVNRLIERENFIGYLELGRFQWKDRTDVREMSTKQLIHSQRLEHLDVHCIQYVV